MLIRAPLDEMLDLRSGFIQKFQAKSDEEKMDGLHLAVNDRTPHDFETVSKQFNSVEELAAKAQSEFDVMKTRTSNYEKSMSDGEPDALQKEKYDAMVHHKTEVLNKTWETLVSTFKSIPAFLKSLKMSLLTLSDELKKVDSTKCDPEFLENEKQLNLYFVKALEEKTTSVRELQKKMKAFDNEMKPVDEKIKAHIRASSEKHFQRAQAAHERAQELQQESRAALGRAIEHAKTIQASQERMAKMVREEALGAVIQAHNLVSEGAEAQWNTGKINELLKGSHAPDEKKENSPPRLPSRSASGEDISVNNTGARRGSSGSVLAQSMYKVASSGETNRAQIQAEAATDNRFKM